MNSSKTNILNDIIITKDTKYNWHEDPYSYYSLAKEIDLPYNLYEIFSKNLKDPQEQEEQKAKTFYKNNDIQIKKIPRPRVSIPIIETVILENGQITSWIYNDKKGNVSKKPLKKLGTDYLTQHFLSIVKNHYYDEYKIFKKIPDSKILLDLPKYAAYIMQKKENRDEKLFKANNLEYIDEMEKIKYILIYYYSQKEPMLTDFINFYFMLNEHGGINSIKMIQNCINCKQKASINNISSLKTSFNTTLFSKNQKSISEKVLRQITVKYAKPKELEQKKYYVYYEKPSLSGISTNNGELTNNIFNTNYFNNKTPNYKNLNTYNKFQSKFKNSKKIVINAEPKKTESKSLFKKTFTNNDLIDINDEKPLLLLEPSINNSAEKSNTKKIKNKNLEENALDDSFEKNKFKYYLKGGKKNDGKIMNKMEKIEENLILQNNDLLNRTLSNLSERLIKYIEKTKHIIILYAYFIFDRMNSFEKGDDDYYSFQKCLLLYGIDKNEEPVLAKTYVLRQNMKNIINKRIPEDVNKFRNFEKYTKNDFCHGEFCNYIVPNYFKGIKQQVFPKYKSRIPKENKISIRGKNKELPGKIPLFEIKKIYDNPELTNLVLKAYSIFPPSFNKEVAIEKLVKERNKKIFLNEQNSELSQRKNKDEEEDSKKNIEDLEDEYGSVMDSCERISDKIQEYENEFKQNIIVYTPTPGKFLHVDYNDMYTEKGVCEKCYKIYTIILEFMRNIDECTQEFKDLIKAKQFLIRGENLRVNNFEDKNSNDNNLIVQEELGKMSVKKFLGIKILKLKLEELNRLKKKQRTRIDRNVVTHKQELNKTFNYNLNINLRLLLANLLAEKTNNQFFNVLFNEIYNEDDTIFRHLDIKKPKIIFEKTNMKDLRLQMGISSLAYNPNYIIKNRDKKGFVHNMIKNNLEKQKNEQILKNIQQQICQVNKNLFQEYNILIGFDNEKSNSSRGYSFEKDNISENSEKIKKFDKHKVIDEVFEYFRIPTISRIRRFSVDMNEYCNNDDDNYKLNISLSGSDLKENYSVEVKDAKLLLKIHKLKKSNKKRKEMSNNFAKRGQSKKIYNFIQIKSLEEIKKQKEKQLEEFLRFDPKKLHLKGIDSNNAFNNKKDRKNSMSSSNSNEDSENNSNQTQNPLAILFEDENWEYYDSQENSSSSEVANWDKDKVVVTSLFYNKTTTEFQESNSSPYYYITTPFPRLKDFNSTQRINENPLDMLRKMNSEQFSSLGNFMNENNSNINNEFDENEEYKPKKGKYLLNSRDVKIYADDKYTAVPYEILDYNDYLGTGNKNNKKKNNNKNGDSKKYIVFVINDFYDTYVKYRYFFNMVIQRLRCYKDLSKKTKDNSDEDKKKKENKNIKSSISNILIKNKFNIISTKSSTESKEKEKENKIYNLNTDSDGNEDKKDIINKINEENENINKDDDINNEENNKNQNKEKNEDNDKISELKFVLFNLPGQSTTFFSKDVIQNNMYYTDFLDRFIYFLFKEKDFDISYKIILLGFGNGGHIALTYASLYEKYWNILDSIIMFNAYCRNGPIVNQTMLEVLKLVTKENNPKNIDFFIKQSTHNPKEFNSKEYNNKLINKKKEKEKKNFFGLDDEYMEIQKKIRKGALMNDKKKTKENKSYNKTNYKLFDIKENLYNMDEDNNNENNENDNYENNITLDGYRSITKGYFYNIKINLKDISTKILCIHSNVDSFINIHNISPLFDNDIGSYHSTPLKELFYFTYKNKNGDTSNINNINIVINEDNFNKKSENNLIIKKRPRNKEKINSVMGYNLNDFKNKENNARKLIIFDGSHDVSYSPNDKENIICTTLISYFN